MKCLTLLLFCLVSLYLPAQVVRNAISPAKLSCLQVGEVEYMLYKNTAGEAFDVYIKTDRCDLLELKKETSALALTADVYIGINGKLTDLGMDQTHAIMHPTAVYYEKGNGKLLVLEMHLISFIATAGYNYIIIDLEDNSLIRYVEFSERLPLKNLMPVFKKYRQSKYDVVEVKRS